MKKELISSVVLHVMVVLVILFGRWPTRDMKDKELLIPIDIVNISDITQSNKPDTAGTPAEKPKPDTLSKAEEPPKPPEPKAEPQAQPQPQPPKSDGMVKDPQSEKEEAAAEKEPEEQIEEEEVEEEMEEEVEPEAIPDESAPDPEPAPEPKPAPAPEKPKEIKPPSLPKPKPKAPKKEKPVKEKKDAFQGVLKNLLETQPSKVPQSEDQDVDEDAVSDEESDDLPKGKTMSISEKDALKKQLERCWTLDAGAKGAKDLNVPIKIIFNPDASIKSVEFLEKERYHADPFYRAAAQRAKAALYSPECTPLKLPHEHYEEWKEIRTNFNPSKMVR